METVTLLLSLAKIIGTGVLTRAAGNTFDSVSPKIQEFFGVIQSKLPDSKTAKALKAGQELDHDQTVIDVKPITQDPEVLKLADEVRSLIAQNQELQAKLDAEVVKIRVKNIQVNRDQSSGNSVFNEKVEAKFVGGTHYHGKDDWLNSTGREPPKTTTPHNLPNSGALKFIGRSEDLDNLHQQLEGENPVVISAISGMGGIGKSELALQYAYQYLESTYPGGICWLNAREDVGSNIGLNIVKFARVYANLEPPMDWHIVDQVRWCWQKWRSVATLIVFDDVQNYDDIRSFLPPPKSQFRTLLTSRHKFPLPVRNYPIDVLNKDNKAIELLGSFDLEVKVRIDADLSTAQAICHWLGYLPLGLELVGWYLANDLDLSITEVWQYLQSEKLRAQALVTAEAGMTLELGVIAAFELSWQKLTPLAQSLAARLSLFALAEIPWILVEQCLSEWHPQELKDVRNRSLLGASLLTRTKQGMYELHQLLREFFTLKLAEMPQREEFTTKFAQVLTEVAKNIPQTVTIEHQTNLIEFIPHIAVASELSQYLDGENKIWCCAGLARFYQAQSQFTMTESWYQKSLAISEKQLVTEHLSTIHSLSNLAELYRLIGKYPESETLYQKSLAISEKRLGAEHLSTATILNNLANLYESMGYFSKAEQLHLKSLAICEQQLGMEDIRTAASVDNLAHLYTSMGKYKEAKSLCLRSIFIREHQLGADHHDTASSLNNLAELYYDLGSYTDAEPLYIKSLAIREKYLGADHPATATSLNNLALLYHTLGSYTDAEPLYIRSLAIREKYLGADHPATATSLNNLAGMYHDIGRYAEAEPLYLRSLAIRETRLGVSHHETKESLNNLAALYYDISRYTATDSFP